MDRIHYLLFCKSIKMFYNKLLLGIEYNIKIPDEGKVDALLYTFPEEISLW